MSHNINTYIGRQAAWHNLGTVTGNYFTWADILAHGGLDFEVFKSQLHDGLGRKVDAWGTFRWDLSDKQAGNKDAATFLGVVGEGYKVIHHSKGFELIDAIMSTQNGAHYETAGVLGNGEVVWGLADLNLSFRIGDDEHKNYLLFYTSHNGSFSYRLKPVNTRVVCANTLGVAASEKTKASFRIKHTVNADLKLESAHKALANLTADVQSVQQKLTFLATRKVTREALDKIMDRLFPKKPTEDGESESSTRRDNIVSSVLANYESNDKNAFPEQRGTSYNLLNAITEYVDHDRSTKGDAKTNRAESALFGSGDGLKSQAMEVIYETANGLPEIKTQVIFSDAPKKPATSATGFTGIDSIDFDAVPYAV